MPALRLADIVIRPLLAGAALGGAAQGILSAAPPAPVPEHVTTPGTNSLCVRGAAATLQPETLTRWHAAQHASAAENAPDPLAGASDFTPVPEIVRLVNHSLIPREAAPTGRSVAAVLELWEQASRPLAPVTERDQHWLRRMNAPAVSAHALAAAQEFLGPVTVSGLDLRYAWSVRPGNDPAVIELSAVPRDETARLFCKEIRVKLSADARRVTALSVVERGGESLAIALPAAVPSSPVTLVKFDGNDLPPSPVRPAADVPLIRFAAEAIEVREVR